VAKKRSHAKVQLPKITHSSIQNTPFHLNVNTHCFNNLLPLESSPPPRVIAERNNRPNQTIKGEETQAHVFENSKKKKKQKSSYRIILVANCAAKFVSFFASKNPAGIFLALACMRDLSTSSV
jgi:hypothetical protein